MKIPLGVKRWGTCPSASDGVVGQRAGRWIQGNMV